MAGRFKNSKWVTTSPEYSLIIGAILKRKNNKTPKLNLSLKPTLSISRKRTMAGIRVRSLLGLSSKQKPTTATTEATLKTKVRVRKVRRVVDEKGRTVCIKRLGNI